MKAIVYHQYGSPDVLMQEEVNRPAPKSREVLVKVKATSINSWDWDLVACKPHIYRLLFGLFKPRYKIIGCDVAGVVESVGKDVKYFKPGDEVFGDISGTGFGAFAEYVCTHESKLAIKPAAISFEVAAAIPQAGVLALQGLRSNGGVKSGYELLINGAGGGVGTFAIQMAKLRGARVTVVDRREKLDFLRSLGADYTIDYEQEDYTKNGKQYDMVLDVIAKRSITDYKRSLKPNGAFVMVGGSVSALLKVGLIGSWIARPRKMGILMHTPNREDLETLAVMYEKGELKPIIDKVYPLAEASEAMRYFGEGRFKGKILITV